MDFSFSKAIAKFFCYSRVSCLERYLSADDEFAFFIDIVFVVFENGLFGVVIEPILRFNLEFQDYFGIDFVDILASWTLGAGILNLDAFFGNVNFFLRLVTVFLELKKRSIHFG